MDIRGVEAGGCRHLARWRAKKSRQLVSSPRASASQRPRTQQREFVEHEAGIGGYGGQSVDRRLRFVLVAVGPASEQQFHQNFGGPSAPDHVAALVRAVHDCPHHFDGTIEIAGAGLLHRKLGLDNRQCAQGEPLRQGGIVGLGEQVEARLALRAFATNQDEASS